MNSEIDWNNAINKEAKGIDDTPLGQVKNIVCGFVISQRDPDGKFCIPQNAVESYDGNVLKFNVSRKEAEKTYLV